MDKLKEPFKHSPNKGIRIEDISSYWFAVRTITASGFQSRRPLCLRVTGGQTLSEFDWVSSSVDGGECRDVFKRVPNVNVNWFHSTRCAVCNCL